MARATKLLAKEFRIRETEPPMSEPHAAKLLKQLRNGGRQKLANMFAENDEGFQVENETIVEESRCTKGGEYFLAIKRTLKNGRVILVC